MTPRRAVERQGTGTAGSGIAGGSRLHAQRDGDAAIAWLKSIPQRFLPREIEKVPVVAPVQDRAEFNALFRSGG